MIDLFVGGHLFHPAALEYSGNKCTHGCCYCFANINKKDRANATPIKSPIRQLYRTEAITHADKLLMAGHTICISNRTDPFSRENYRNTIALASHLERKKNSIFFQTKTGTGMNEVCDIFGKRRDIIFYVTVTTTDAGVSRRIEPFAPLPSERLKVAKQLHEKGYMVIIAVNPMVEEWMSLNDLKKLVNTLKGIGIKHICIEMLDMSVPRLKKLSQSRRNMLGDAIIAGVKTNKNNNNRMYVRQATNMLIDLGMEVAKKGMPFYTDFFNNIKNRVHLSYPVIQDFVNYCIAKYKKNPTLIKYGEYESVMAQGDVFNVRETGDILRSYLLRSDFRTWLDNKNNIHSHRDLLKILWNDNRARTSIQRHCLFKIAQRNNKNVLDNEGNIQLYFDGTPNMGEKGVIEI